MLVTVWICMVPFIMSFHFWLPSISGVSLGRVGDFLVSAATLAMVSVLFWIQLRKLPNHPMEPLSPGRGGS